MESAVAMIDRLPALKERSGFDSRHSVISPSDTEAQEVEHINQVLTNVDETNRLITELADKTEKLKFNHAIILSSFQSQDARDDNEKLNKEIKRLSQTIHGRLKQMKDSLDSHGNGQQLADYRIKATQYAVLSRRFRDSMEEYNWAQERYREKSKECIENQLKYVEKELSNEQVEAMLESSDTNIFAQNIILDTDSSEVKRLALGEVEARHEEILKLEQDIKELHQMFYDLFLLVEEQGEMINRIETNIENAAEWIGEGTAIIKQCVNVADQRPKLCCCCY